MNLNVKLRDGFNGETVTVRIDGKEVFRKAVKTDLTISLADMINAAVQKPSVDVEIAVEGGPTVRREVQVNETPFVDVRVSDGKLLIQPSREEIPML